MDYVTVQPLVPSTLYQNKFNLYEKFYRTTFLNLYFNLGLKYSTWFDYIPDRAALKIKGTINIAIHLYVAPDPKNSKLLKFYKARY